MKTLGWVGEVLLAGLLSLLPVYLTIQVLVWTFGFVDHSFGKVFEPIFGRHIPGSGVVATVMLVFCVGVLTRWWLTQRVIDAVEASVLRVPGLGQLYKAIKRLLDPLTRKEDRPFKEAVWVPISDELMALGFITSSEVDVADEDGEGRVSVYLPSCHPYFGMVALAKRKDLKPAPVHLDEAVSYEFSFGAATPPGIQIKPRDEVED
jgi:uncharacterized membrane protein